MKIKLPKKLGSGSRIEFAAPSSPFNSNQFAKSLVELKSRGYNVVARKAIYKKQEYLAGTDAHRSKALVKALESKKNDAVFFARGGYGCTRIMPQVMQQLPKALNSEKMIMGLSDLTVLLNWLAATYRMVTLHGPVWGGNLYQNLSKKVQKSIFEQLENPLETILLVNKDYTIFKKGHAKAKLFGGNLSMVCAALSTPYEVPSKNKILFLEEVGEAPYSVDRLVTQLGHSGKLKHLKGLVLGDFTDTKGKFLETSFVAKLFKPYLPKETPILLGVKSGHVHQDYILPIGKEVEILPNGKSFFLGPVVSP